MAKKHWYPLSYFTPLFFLVIFGASLFWKGYSLILIPLFSFGLVPLIDKFIGRDSDNFSEESYQKWEKSLYYDFILVFLFFGVLSSLYGSLWSFVNHNFSFFETLGLIFSLGLVTGGMGITLAHELGHRKEKVFQLMAKTLLVHVGYGHFYVEHNKGHHRFVSTEKDPASSRFGESLYRFLPRTLIGSFKSAFHLGYLDKKDKVFWKNQTFILSVVTFLIAIVCGYFGGVKGVILFCAQAMMAILFLEIINYVEHYGLERKRNESGRYEKVQPYHSWNSDYIFSNALLLNLQRHSDHHAFVERPYQNLRTHDKAPQLPWGYPTMMLLALIPFLWKKVVHPLIPENKVEL